MRKAEIDLLINRRFNVQNGGKLPFVCLGSTREMLAKFMGEIGLKVGAEIGVLRGAYSETLCKSIPGLKIKCIDPWLSFRRNSQARMDSHYNRTRWRLRQFDAEIIKKTSMEAVRDVPDKSLDFVYIDAMHEFDPVMLDLISWSDKVRSGGIVAGHDYSPPAWYNGVVAAVCAYTEVHGITSWYITDDEDKTYFWVKP